MRLLKAIPFFVFLAVNLLMASSMAFCAYTSCLPPQDYPKLSYFGLMFPFFLLGNTLFVPFWLLFRRKMVVVPIAALLLCAGSVRAYLPLNFPSEAPEGSLKILSYNVMAFGEENQQPWQENPIMTYLFESGADIICLQEARKTVIDSALDSISTRYPYHHLELRTDNYICCFSKYPIDSVAQIDYYTKTNCSFVYWLHVDDDTLLLVNNHLESYKLSASDKEDYKSIIENYQHPEENDSEVKYLGLTGKLSRCDSIRGMQADSVAAFVEKNEKRHIVVCGDFNASPISYVHHRLTRPLNDAYTRSGNGAGTSYNRSGMYFRIDHMLVSPNVTPYQAKVDKSISASDHYPISCHIKLE